MTDESSKLDEKQRTQIKLTEVSDIDDSTGDGQSKGGDSLIEPRHSFISSDEQSSASAVEDSSKSLAESNRASSLPHKPEIHLSDDYDVLELIGQGATGQVYKVRDKNLDRIIAVKVLRKDLVVDNQTVKRFNHEAEAAAGLSHGNVVSVYGHGEAKDGSPYITMNYIEGESLASILKKEPKLDWHRAVSLFIQICDGLEHAHANGLVHRDLKPSNIIVSTTESGVELAHIVDFGIAKVIANRTDTLNTLTASGDFLGTPMYMSPEQCLGQNVDHRTDFYALGCMLFEAVSGKSPFAGANTVEIIAKKMSEQSPILRSDNLPPAISMIVSCCMARHPQDRYESAQQLRIDLESLEQKHDPRHAQLRFGMDKKLFGKRLLAFLIDNIILSSASGILSFILVIPFIIVIGILIAVIGSTIKGIATDLLGQLVVALIYFVFPVAVVLAYNTLFECKRGTTPGKQLMGLTVCDLYGNKLSAKQAFLRNGSKMALLAVLPTIGLSGFFAPMSNLGLLTLIGSAGLAYFIFKRSWTVHHQAPWDVWVGTQIRRR